jgi:GntR family transcriptional repressor for pyruvate dehydrogenase complex
VREINPNPVLVLLAESASHIYSSRTAHGGANLFTPETRIRLHLDHIRIADAIQHGDPDSARRLMREHMASASEAIFDASPELADELVDWQ